MNDLGNDLQHALGDRYRLEGELGQGGMATVYLAHDLKHERKVAIKVLRPDLAAVIGAERFLREIRTIATLQHPHILGLIDSGGVNGTAYYVMPFAEGESLRDRLNREKQLPIADAVRIAREVASALDYAHRHGIVHRDIKPENVMLHDGSALVADFGIALAVSSAGGTRMTETGMSLGTPHYMSPEQAMGEREITARSDVYALGAITYEMLVGEPPFTGPTAQAIVARVLTAEPAPPSSIRKTVPSSVDDAVRTALQKLPADRFASAAEFAMALEAPTSRTGATGAARVATSSSRWRRVSLALGLVSLALAGVSAWALTRDRATMGPRVYDIGLPDSAVMAFAATTVTSSYGLPLRNLSVAPSGEFAVYTVQQGDSAAIWYRSLRDAAAHSIPGTAGGVAPRVSPDGQRIEFQKSGRVMVVPAAGGVARQLMGGTAVMSVEWISPTQLLVLDRDGYRVSWLDVDQGLVRSKPSQRCAFGTWIPGERRLTCSLSMTGSVMDPDSNTSWLIRSARPDGTAGPPLAGSDFRVVAGRYLLYMSVDGELRAAHYDPVRHVAGRSVTVLTGLRREAVGDAQYDLTQDGTLVFAPGADAGTGRMVRLSSGGSAQPLPLPQAAYQRFDVSPDGRRLAVVVQTPEGQELRISDLHSGQQLTWLRAEYVGQPLWSRDGVRLLLSARDSTRSAILIGAPSSGLPPDTLAAATTPALVDAPMDFPSDHLAVASNNTTSMILAFDPSARPLRFDTVAADSRFTMIAPDERHVVYQTAETGRIIVGSWPNTSQREQISDGGVEPIWLSASQLLYRLGVSWYEVRIDPVSGAPVAAPALWARDPRFSDTAGWSNRVSRDGGIVYVQGPEQTHASYLRVVPNWVAGMKAAVDRAGP